MSRNMQGVDNPVTPQALVVVNATYDRRFYHQRAKTQRANVITPYGGLDADNFKACRHELAFTQPGVSAHLNAPSQSATSQNDLPIFTSFNGMAIDSKYKLDGSNTDEEMDELYRKMRAKVKFVGINLTTIDASNSNRNDAMSIVLGGMMTVNNTGEKRLGNMDRVVWDVPVFANDKERRAKLGHYLPRTKHVGLILPYDEAVKRELDAMPGRIVSVIKKNYVKDETLENERIFTEAMVALFKEMTGESTATINSRLVQALENPIENGQPNPKRSALRRFLETARYVTAGVDERVIGTAADSAFPGNNVDLLLRHSM